MEATKITADERNAAHKGLTIALQVVQHAIEQAREFGFDCDSEPIVRQINNQFSIINNQRFHRQ